MRIRNMKRILTFILSFCLAINPAVMNAFYRDGGTIVKAYAIMVDGQPCWGAYYEGHNQIRIRTDAPDTTLAHEIGHWIYCKQVWSGELQDTANKAFAQSPLRECNDENFARGYAMYCERELGGALGKFYQEVEAKLF